jgi:hypothetical protein
MFGVFAALGLLEPAAWISMALVATWAAILLSAFVSNSRALMTLALWSLGILAVLPVAIGIALAE